MGIRPLYIFVTSFSAGIDFIRQKPTSKVGLRAERIYVIIASKAVSSLCLSFKLENYKEK